MDHISIGGLGENIDGLLESYVYVTLALAFEEHLLIAAVIDELLDEVLRTVTSS